MIVLADFHVHFYPTYGVEMFCKSAISNFRQHLITIQSNAYQSVDLDSEFKSINYPGFAPLSSESSFLENPTHQETSKHNPHASPSARVALCLLFLTERQGQNFYQDVFNSLSKNNAKNNAATQPASEPESEDNNYSEYFYLRDGNIYLKQSNGFEKIFEICLIPGRQIISQEKLEILILNTQEKFQDGLPFDKIISSLVSKYPNKVPQLVVLPWSPGKWLGTRALVLEEFFKKYPLQFSTPIYLGDIAMHKFFQPKRLLNMGIAAGLKVLCGSDSLNYPKEVSLIGNYGNYFKFTPKTRASKPTISVESSSLPGNTSDNTSPNEIISSLHEVQLMSYGESRNFFLSLYYVIKSQFIKKPPNF